MLTRQLHDLHATGAHGRIIAEGTWRHAEQTRQVRSMLSNLKSAGPADERDAQQTEIITIIDSRGLGGRRFPFIVAIPRGGLWGPFPPRRYRRRYAGGTSFRGIRCGPVRSPNADLRRQWCVGAHAGAGP